MVGYKRQYQKPDIDRRMKGRGLEKFQRKILSIHNIALPILLWYMTSRSSTRAEAVLLSHDYCLSPKQDLFHVHKTTYVCHGHP